jgi:uncharacterized membrane protein YcaP (DUF421 family)
MPHLNWFSSNWTEVFWPVASVAEKAMRPVIVYVFLVGALRIFGKRELAQLNAFDLVVLLMLSNTVQNAIIGDDNSVMGGLIGAVALLTVNFVIVRATFKNQRLDHLVEGHPRNLIENGKIIKSALAKEKLTDTELKIAAQRQGFSKIEEIKTAVLEPGGSFNVTGVDPSTEDRRFNEIIKRLDELGRQVTELKNLSNKS